MNFNEENINPLPRYNISFLLRDTVQKNICTVHCRITINGQRSADFSTNVKVERKEWNHKTATRKHRKLKYIYDQIENTILMMHHNNMNIDVHEIYKKLNDNKRYTLIQALDHLALEREKEIGKLITKGTFRTITNRINNLKHFAEATQKDNIRACDVDYQFCDLFIKWGLENGWKSGHIAKTLNTLKESLRLSVTYKKIQRSKINDYKYKKTTQVNIRYVTKSQLAAVKELEIEGITARVRVLLYFKFIHLSTMPIWKVSADISTPL